VPVIVTINGYRLFFYSNEGSPREPLHVHVKRAGCEAKVWLEPNPRVASSYGFSPREIREVEALTVQYTELIRSRWNEYFDG